MSNAHTIIAALRSGHDSLADLVPKLGDDDLTRPSGAAEWDISQVLSHLGSGAVITRATVQAALEGDSGPDRDLAMTVWDEWNAMSRRERADRFLPANNALTELYETMNAGTRENLRIDMGSCPRRSMWPQRCGCGSAN